MADASEVVAFLGSFKGCLILDLFHIEEREKNLQALFDLGMDCTERKEVLLGLEPKNYVKGPEPDEMYNEKEFWFFGSEFNGTEIYIKMRIIPDPKNSSIDIALIWSFHPAEQELTYPLANY